VESVNLEEKEGQKWVRVIGTALKVGKSKNGVNYRISNLKEADGSMFSVIVGHRVDYDNPDHNVGEGQYHLEGEDVLKYNMKVKNTTTHPDIIEQIVDELVAPSIQGKYDAIEVQEDNSVIVEGIHIPLLALVNKHVRGVEGATIESAIAERIELNKSKTQEVSSMEEKDVFAKQIKEKDTQLGDANKKIEEADKELAKANKLVKEQEDKLKKIEEAKKLEVAKSHEDKVDKIVETNSDLKKEELMEKTDGELDIIEKYEIESANKPADTGAGVVGQINESVNDAKGDKENVLDLKLMEKHGDLTMNEEAYKEFNLEVKKRVLGE
ncbi:hypothetical protein LCGC14_2165370, partial [marine sediment metagenome]